MMSANAPLVLLVEDDPSLGQLLTEELEADGYAVVGAATVQDARKALKEQRPALIVSDLRLPDGDGDHVLRNWPVSRPTTSLSLSLSSGGRLDGHCKRCSAGPWR